MLFWNSNRKCVDSGVLASIAQYTNNYHAVTGLWHVHCLPQPVEENG